jgi:G3E family GTPase
MFAAAVTTVADLFGGPHASMQHTDAASVDVRTHDGSRRAKVPLTILSGFLGAGKTTLLGRLLRQQHGQRVAVVQNERGMTLGVEQALTVSDGATQEWLELANGCVCCTVKDDLLITLEQLLERSREKGLPFHHIIIETSGLADPAPLLEVFWVDSALEADLYLDAVVTVCDACHISEHIEKTVEAQRQIAFSDRVLLNKCDLASADVLERAMADIKRLNNLAVIFQTTFSDVALDQLVGVHAFDPQRAASLAFAAAATTAVPRPMHSSDISTLNVRVPGWLEKGKLKSLLASVLWSDPPLCDVLRMKGALALFGKACQYSLQCVRQTWAIEKTPLVVDAPPLSSIVIIGRKIESVDWHRRFAEQLHVKE